MDWAFKLRTRRLLFSVISYGFESTLKVLEGDEWVVLKSFSKLRVPKVLSVDCCWAGVSGVLVFSGLNDFVLLVERLTEGLVNFLLELVF